MTRGRIEIAPELVRAGRRLFEETETPQHEIAAMMGISDSTLRLRIREWGWERRPQPGQTLDLLHAARGAATAAALDDAPPVAGHASDPNSPQQRAAIAARIQNVIEREMTAVERMLDTSGTCGESGAGNNARALAGIARTLREVALLIKPEQVTPPHEADDDPIPRDIDAFRDELARRIEAFVAAERAAADREVSDDQVAPALDG